MDIDIIQEEDNPMLHRTDVRFEVTHEAATPSRLSVRDSLAAMLNKDAEEVVVHELDTKFGMRQTVGYAKVYESPEHAQDVEQAHMLQRNKIAADGEGVIEAEEEEDEAEDEAEAESAEAEEEENDAEQADAEEVDAGDDAEEDAEEADADEDEADAAEAQADEAAAEEAEADADEANEDEADDEGESESDAEAEEA